jgi:hypothetical protein
MILEGIDLGDLVVGLDSDALSSLFGLPESGLELV